MFLENGDPEQAVAAADKLVRPQTYALGVTSAEATESLKRTGQRSESWQAERAALRKRLQELEAADRKRTSIDGAITVLVPNPDAPPLVASVVGRDPLIVDTTNRWIEVTLSPHELREAAMRKAAPLLGRLPVDSWCPACRRMRHHAMVDAIPPNPGMGRG